MKVERPTDLEREPAGQQPISAAERGGRETALVVRVLNYLTNHVVAHVPSFALRHAWYRNVLGVSMGKDSGIHMGCYVWFYGPRHLRRVGLEIGENTRINRDCCLDARGSVRIGNNVSISPQVAILTAQHRVDTRGFPVESRPVVIADHVWIGLRATILPGTTIGHGAVVAAGAVARGEIPAMTIVAGVPARRIGTRPPEGLDYVLDQPFPLFE